jgi:hypothetical protein
MSVCGRKLDAPPISSSVSLQGVLMMKRHNLVTETEKQTVLFPEGKMHGCDANNLFVYAGHSVHHNGMIAVSVCMRV